MLYIHVMAFTNVSSYIVQINVSADTDTTKNDRYRYCKKWPLPIPRIRYLNTLLVSIISLLVQKRNNVATRGLSAVPPTSTTAAALPSLLWHEIKCLIEFLFSSLFTIIFSAGQALFGTFPPWYQRSCFILYVSHYSFAIILVSTSSSWFTLAVPTREVFCVGYTPRAWGHRSL